MLALRGYGPLSILPSALPAGLDRAALAQLAADLDVSDGRRRGEPQVWYAAPGDISDRLYATIMAPLRAHTGHGATSVPVRKPVAAAPPARHLLAYASVAQSYGADLGRLFSDPYAYAEYLGLPVHYADEPALRDLATEPVPAGGRLLGVLSSASGRPAIYVNRSQAARGGLLTICHECAHHIDATASEDACDTFAQAFVSASEAVNGRLDWLWHPERNPA
jgi:hypothetical protein